MTTTPGGAMRGFTMIELIVVMALVATLGVLALPAFDSRTPLNQLGVRDQVGAMLEYSRKLAMVQHRSVCVMVTATTVQAVYAPGNVCSAASWVDQPANVGTQFKVAVPSDVVMGGAALVQFDSQGQLLPNVTTSITMGPHSVTVSNETGLVTYI
jgi:prepilin-type N-terminal cleavage/methylation domain-containing protein